jgi:hypothetical protein
MTLGDDVYTCTDKELDILQKVYALYDHYVGEDRVFPIKNGAPRIMTKYKDTPYSYELQPEYAAGNKISLCKGNGLDRENSISPSHSRFRAEHTSRRELCPAAVHLKISHCAKVRTGTDEG